MDKRIVVGVHICTNRGIIYGPYLWVHTIYTSPKFRRQGIAKALYKHLDDVCARAHGCSEVWLDVYNVNPTSEKTHRALGAVPVTQIYKRKVGAD